MEASDANNTMEKENQTNSSNQEINKFVADHVNSGDIAEPKVIVILEGVAPKQLDAIKPNKVHLFGIITAPSAFLAHRAGLHDPKKAHVLYDFQAKKITLVFDEQFENDNHKVTGTLQDNPELAVFKINTGNTFGSKELMNILKFNRVHFADRELCNRLCFELMTFKATIQKQIEETNDLQGNQANVKISKLETELQRKFILEMPIFKGQPKIKFEVDVCLEFRAGEPLLFLESRELKDSQMTSAEAIIKGELAKFTNIVCIEQ